MSDENVVALKPTASVVVVTPEIASRWLAKNVKNRNIRAAEVAAYARDMAAGNWQVTGEAIKFDRNGNLIDGQHRLMAIIRSEMSIPLFVVRGLSSDAQDVMDSGAKRGAADALHLGGHKNASIVASTARLAMMLGSGNDVSKDRKYTHSEIAEWVTANPDVDAAATAATSLKKTVELSPSVMALTWLMFARVDQAACAEFWESIANNATNGKGDPRNTLISRVAAARRSGERLTQAAQIAFTVRAWNAWRNDKPLHILKTRSSDSKGGSTKVSIPRAV